MISLIKLIKKEHIEYMGAKKLGGVNQSLFSKVYLNCKQGNLTWDAGLDQGLTWYIINIQVISYHKLNIISNSWCLQARTFAWVRLLSKIGGDGKL